MMSGDDEMRMGARARGGRGWRYESSRPDAPIRAHSRTTTTRVRVRRRVYLCVYLCVYFAFICAFILAFAFVDVASMRARTTSTLDAIQCAFIHSPMRER